MSSGPRAGPGTRRRTPRPSSRALAELHAAPRDDLFAERSVGRQALSTTQFGLLFHLAEHTQRHTGQVITTAKLLRGRDA